MTGAELAERLAELREIARDGLNPEATISVVLDLSGVSK